MPFSFNFGFSVPFAAAAVEPEADPSQSRAPQPLPTKSILAPRRRPSPTPTARTSRKRGWEPSDSNEPSLEPTFASTGGYLDTPAKYRGLAVGEHARDEPDYDDLPPAKRRRTLAGSIVSNAVSTALSTVLIGTAVGLTVYRLWRDRGKGPEQLRLSQGETPAPPPYQLADPRVIPPTPPRQTTAHRRTRQTAVSSPRRPPRARRAQIPKTWEPPRSLSPAAPSFLAPSPQPHFDFGSSAAPLGSPPDEDLDEMDWIGDKLSMLIEEGKKALGREIVVGADAPEDEVDDGAGDWVEDEAGPSSRARRRAGSTSGTSNISRTGGGGGSISRAGGSISRAAGGSIRRRDEGQDVYYTPGARTMPFSAPLPLPLPPPTTPDRGQGRGHHHHRRGESMESPNLGASPFKEDESAWESPEMKESMARARARFLQSRG